MEQTAAQSSNPSDYAMRKQHSTGLRNRFLDTIRRYQQIESEFRQKYRQRVERQIRIGQRYLRGLYRN